MSKFIFRVVLLCSLVAAGQAQVPQAGHVFIVVEENTNYSSVIGSSSMPYLNSLATQYGLATQDYANTHPSIGNYFMLTAGQIVTNNDSYVPPSGGLNVDNVVRHLLTAGKTWKAYEEDLPSVGYLTPNVAKYARKHCPLSYFSDVMGSSVQINNLVPFTQLAKDLANSQLPDYSFITPNLCNDAHDCSLTTADNWLKANIGPLIASATFQKDGILVIVFDESGSDNTNGGGKVAWVVVSPLAKKGYKSTTTYQHQSTLRMMLEALGLTSFPGAAATAPQMGEFFGSSTPVVQVAIAPTSATVASGGTKQFTDTVTGTTRTAVNWSASAGTVSTSGLYTAPTVSVNTSATVKATSVADSTKSATASITITPPPPSGTNPNFSLSATPPSQTVVRGSTVKYTTKVTPSSGFAGSVAFAVNGLSGGASASFSPASVTVSGTTSASSTMTIATGKGRTGTFTLTISASSRSITHSTTVSVTTTR